MITREMQLKKKLEEQLKREVEARDLYVGDIKKLKNKDLIKDLDFIKKEEEEHIALLKKLIAMLD